MTQTFVSYRLIPYVCGSKCKWKKKWQLSEQTELTRVDEDKQRQVSRRDWSHSLSFILSVLTFCLWTRFCILLHSILLYITLHISKQCAHCSVCWFRARAVNEASRVEFLRVEFEFLLNESSLIDKVNDHFCCSNSSSLRTESSSSRTLVKLDSTRVS